MINFLKSNWVNILLIIVGTFALVIYILQERRKKIDAASLIVLQIDEVLKRLIEISTFIAGDGFNSTAFYESLPLMKENYWSKYKHYFVRNMDAASYDSINRLYNYVAGVQEQQLLAKTLQTNSINLIQTIIMNMEAGFISDYLNGLYGNDLPVQIEGSSYLKFNVNQFWVKYKEKDEQLRMLINNGAFAPIYSPVQIKQSLDKILTECSLLGVTGTDGYQLLKKKSKRRF